MNTIVHSRIWLVLLAITASLSGCAGYQVAPDECPL